jgi:hypothetical protein
MPKKGGKQAKRQAAAWAIRHEGIASSRRPMTAEEASEFLAGIRKGQQVLRVIQTSWSTHAQQAETICRRAFLRTVCAAAARANSQPPKP